MPKFLYFGVLRAVLALLFVPNAAMAGVIAIAVSSNSPERIELSDTVGACVAGAKEARWVGGNDVAQVPACWRLVGGVVELAFLDGDSVRIPMQAFKPVKAS